MPRLALDPARSTLRVWTFKDGLLARLAHDLSLEATGLRSTLEPAEGGDRVELDVPADGLRVRGQVVRGEVTPLGDKEHREIEGNARGPRVLDAARHPTVRFRGAGRREGERVRVEGTLELHGVTRPLSVEGRWREAAGALEVEGEVELRPSEWGIAPYTALLGALKVQDRVRVTWSLRYEGAEA